MDTASPAIPVEFVADLLEVRLQVIDPEVNARKEYRIVVDPAAHTVTTAWGRIGHVNQSKVATCESLGAARALAQTRLVEKLGRGYRAVYALA